MKKYIIPAFCVLLAALSCNKENTVTEEPVEGPKMVTATCTLVDPVTDPNTKVTLSTAGKTSWEVGDEIFIHGHHVGTSGETYYSYVATVASVTNAGKTAVFSIPAEMERYSSSSYNSSLFAAYPASAVADFTNGASWYFYNAFKNTNNLLLCGANDKTVDEYSFAFQSLTGAISFVVDGDFDAYIFSGNNNETVGYSNYAVRIAKGKTGDWDNNLNGYKTEGPSPSAGELKSVSVDSWTGADGSTVNTVYFPNPNNFTFSNGFTIKFLKDGVVKKVVQTHTSKQIKRGQLLNIGNITSHLIDPPATPVNHTDLSDGLDFSTATDLSTANGASNSYIVTAAGQYKLPLVKGNGSTSVGTVKGASILWETYNNSETVTANSVIAAADYYINGDTKYLVFKTPATLKPGNALIAVTNDLGTILWSWHIWIPQSTIVDITDATFSENALMDRNLGAIEKATTSSAGKETYGFYYQWGRKDPFPGAVTSNATVTIETTTGPKDLNYSIQHPTQLIKVDESDSAGNWNTEDITTLWEDSGKTIYDPCPPGYRVPKYNESYKLWERTGTGWTFDWTADYFKYDTSDSVFPLPGNTSGSVTPGYQGSRCVLWSANRHSAPRGYTKIIREDKSGYYYHNYFKMEGGSVRCVKE